MNIGELREKIEHLIQLCLTFASKEELMALEALLKEIRTDVGSNTMDISRLMELLNNLKGAPSSSGGSGASTNDVMLLRSRMEYCENQIKEMKKIITDLKK